MSGLHLNHLPNRSTRAPASGPARLSVDTVRDQPQSRRSRFAGHIAPGVGYAEIGPLVTGRRSETEAG